MCGRFVAPNERALEREFELRRGGSPLIAVWNAAPTMFLPVVHLVDGKLIAEPMQWGLVPTWWKKDELPKSTINARLEEAASKPMWRSSMRYARALVPALGYYEWQKTAAGAKQPYFIHLPGRELLCFAGLWSQWRDVQTFAILTTAAASSVAAIHNRMPVVVPRETWGAWLDPEQKDGTAAAALAQAAAVTMFEADAISTYVNSPRNQGEKCIEPLVQ
jgi:putative SOS response-associated peptidase YedK